VPSDIQERIKNRFFSENAGNNTITTATVKNVVKAIALKTGVPEDAKDVEFYAAFNLWIDKYDKSGTQYAAACAEEKKRLLDTAWNAQTEAQKFAAAAEEAGVVCAKLPTLTIARNGAQSTSVDRAVCNGWGPSKRDGDDRVVLRALAPRTSVISVPAYGINVQGEKEVVVAGTAWSAWDAWLHTAPDMESIPIETAPPSSAENEMKKAA
jgi:hypothetical protein